MPIAPAVGMIVGGLASGAAGLAGHLAQMSAQDRANLLQQKGMQEWLDLQIPDPNEQKLALQHFVSSGQIDPKYEGVIKAADTSLQKIAMDPQLKQARLKALSSLEQQGYGGETVQDAAARQQAMIESGDVNRGHQQAIVGDLARRGQLGGGLELQSRLDQAQNDSNQLAKGSLQQEADRRNRALQAISGAGSLAGDIQGQQLDLAKAQGTAQDAINLFNTKNAQDVSNTNTGISNAAQQYNLEKNQNISNQNVGLSNYEQQYNKNLTQQQFENQKAKAAGVSGQYNQQAQTAQQQGNSAAQMWGNVASGIGTTVAGIANLPQQKQVTPYSYGAPQGPYTQKYLDWWQQQNGGK